MTDDHALALRQAVVALLKAPGSFTRNAGVPVARIFGEHPTASPPFPFVKYGTPTSAPFEASGDGWGGSDHTFLIHAFAAGPGMDESAKLARAIVKDLNGDALPLEGAGLVELDWGGTQHLPDPGGWHAVITFRATTNAVV